MGYFVADANSMLAVLLCEEQSNLGERLGNQMLAGDLLSVPGLWHLEVTNGLLNKLKRKLLLTEQAENAFDLLRSYRVRTDIYSSEPTVISHIWRLAIKHQLTTYDASYLELAMRLGCPLLTGDEALIRSAPLEGVTLL